MFVLETASESFGCTGCLSLVCTFGTRCCRVCESCAWSPSRTKPGTLVRPEFRPKWLGLPALKFSACTRLPGWSNSGSAVGHVSEIQSRERRLLLFRTRLLVEVVQEFVQLLENSTDDVRSIPGRLSWHQIFLNFLPLWVASERDEQIGLGIWFHLVGLRNLICRLTTVHRLTS